MTTLIILTVVLISSVIIAILVLYAIGKIKSIEEITKNLIDQGKDNSEKKKDVSGPFGGLEGKELWDVLTGKKVPEDISATEIENFREQYSAVLSKTIKSIFSDGRNDGKFGSTRSVPKNERLIKTLRVAVSSWIPSHELSSLYNCAYDSARAEGEDLERIRMALDDIIGTLFSKVKLPAPESASDSLLEKTSPDLLEGTLQGSTPDNDDLIRESSEIE